MTRPTRIPVLLDTDTNNEIDDQHAIAYLLANGDLFDVAAITTHRTAHGGELEAHTAEAERVVRLMRCEESVPVIGGARGSFSEICAARGGAARDGENAVEAIRRAAHAAHGGRKLQVIAIGKLTNVALALRAEGALADRLHVTWLGSHWPLPGEYNLDNDPAALAFVLESGVALDVVVVRYGANTGAAGVTVSTAEIRGRLAGRGVRARSPVVGRHGGTFDCFGDYAVSLFEHVGDEGALCDVVALALLKNARWAAEVQTIAAPSFVDGSWGTAPDRRRPVRFFSHFARAAILEDLYAGIGRPALPGP